MHFLNKLESLEPYSNLTAKKDKCIFWMHMHTEMINLKRKADIHLFAFY